MDTFNNRCNGPGEVLRCLQCKFDLYIVQEYVQDMGHLAAWSELSEVYHKFQLPVGCSGMSQLLGGQVRSA